MLDFGDSLFWSPFFGPLGSHKKLVGLVEYSLIRCLQEESKLVGRVKACFVVQCILGVLHTRVLLDYFLWDVVVVYWCVFAGILGLLRCILRVILKIIILALCTKECVKSASRI